MAVTTLVPFACLNGCTTTKKSEQDTECPWNILMIGIGYNSNHLEPTVQYHVAMQRHQHSLPETTDFGLIFELVIGTNDIAIKLWPKYDRINDFMTNNAFCWKRCFDVMKYFTIDYKCATCVIHECVDMNRLARPYQSMKKYYNKCRNDTKIMANSVANYKDDMLVINDSDSKMSDDDPVSTALVLKEM